MLARSDTQRGRSNKRTSHTLTLNDDEEEDNEIPEIVEAETTEVANGAKKDKEKATTKRLASAKPGFDVVLTNAIAPGDEKALMAAALELPAGSTRSGRRVQRS